MTIWEISEKADYIAQSGTVAYRTSGIFTATHWSRITLSKAHLHHGMSCAAEKDLCFVLFEHFRIYVTLADGFNNHIIEYYIESKEPNSKQLIGRAELSIDGKIDGEISNRDREQVLEHYLGKIARVYDGLYAAVESNAPVDLGLLIDEQNPVV